MNLKTLCCLLLSVLVVAGFATSEFAAAAAAGDGSAAGAAPAKAPRHLWTDKLAFPKLNPIENPVVVRETLANGIKLLLIEDHELPKIGIRAGIRGGAFTEPADRSGLTDLFGEVLRSGGTQKMIGDAVDEALERIGASIESGSDDDSVSLRGDMLAENRDQVIGLFAEFLMTPGLQQEKVDLAKTQLRSAISRRNDDPMGIMQREFRKVIYGAGSPYARQLEYADVERMTRDDLVAFHRRTFRPDQVTIAAWGDFKADEMKGKLAGLLGGWKSEGAAPKVELPTIPAPAPSMNYVEKTDVAQAFIIMGHQGLRYDDPDYAAVQLMQEILGGGFSSRIFVTVRTLKGLAYGAGGAMVPAYDHPGNFYFFTSTKPETTAEALAAMLEEVGKIREAPVTDAELTRAREGWLNGYAFQFQSRAQVVNRLMTYDFYGYPADFNAKVKAAVEKVTKDDILRVAKARLHPDELAILVLGDKTKFDKPLASFGAYGPVRAIDIAIPEPKSAAVPAATPESLARGKDLLLRAAKAKGAALAGVKDLTAQGTATMTTPMGPMDLKYKSVFALPDRLSNELTTPMGAVTQVVVPGAAWMTVAGNRQDVPGSAADDMRVGLATEAGCVALLQQALLGTIEGQALGAEPFGGQAAEAVLVRVGGKPLTLFLAADTMRVVGIRKQGQTQEGPAEITEAFGGYKTVSGLELPMEVAVTANGKSLAAVKTDTFQVNAGADPKLFVKP